MKRERKKRLLHELGFTAAEVQRVEELAAKRSVTVGEMLCNSMTLFSRWDSGQVVVMTEERYEKLRDKQQKETEEHATDKAN